ncbi:KH domain-containing protein [Candidatus Saccharibacteria bacterium]|nr:KH domain-containing protein [Candidatus Saccharibacteria bacterium]
MDQQFIEYIIKSIVGHPEDIKIERRIDEKGVLLELSVNPEDLGRVIGKRGATAQSIRTLLRALGTKNDARYNLKIIDTGPPPESRGPAFAEASPFADASEDKSVDGSEGRTEDRGKVPAVATASDDDVVADTPSDDTAVPDDSARADDVDMTEDEELPKTPKEDHSDVVSRTRKELADLDDLDV